MNALKRKYGFLAAALVAALPVLDAHARRVIVDIEAEVVYIDDESGLLAGRVNIGDIVKGRYAYDSKTPDNNPDPHIGDYWHAGPEFGIALDLQGLTFRTDPTATQFQVEIINDLGYDAYRLDSFRNLFDVSAPGSTPDGNHIAWELDDFTAKALHSQKLTGRPPMLSDWDSPYGLGISSTGPDQSFYFAANVTKAEVVDLED